MIRPKKKYLDSILFQQAFASNNSDPVQLKFRTYDQLAQRVEDLEQFGSERINYEIVSDFEEQTDITLTKYSFIIHGNNGVVLAQSDFIFTKRTQQQVEDGVSPGPDDIDVEINLLTRYFGYEFDLYCEADACDNNEDPYSFRTTVILPCWPKRLHDKTFRNLVEKTIQTEFPAHVQTRVVWIGVQEMKQFEEVYFNWLNEMAQNEMPRYEIINPLVEKLNKIKSCSGCDDDCDG